MNTPKPSASVVIPHPLKHYAKTIKLTQFRRSPTDPTWDAKYLIDGTWTGWLTTKTVDRDEAVHLFEVEAAHLLQCRSEQAVASCAGEVACPANL